MAFHYVGGDLDQLFLLPVSMRDWLEEGHVAWFLLDVVAAIDTSKFHARHRNDGPGRPAYDPEMMLALLLYAYSMGVRSSRRIEALCRTDAAFKVICGGVVPDHATVWASPGTVDTQFMRLLVYLRAMNRSRTACYSQ